MGENKRRARKRTFQIDGWRDDMEASGRAWTAASAHREDCGARGTERFGARLCADRDGRRSAVEWKSRAERAAVALGRRRGELATGEFGPEHPREDALLHARRG